MSANLQSELKLPSRRALLTGALGGLGAMAASAIGHPGVARAHDVDDVRLGATNTATTTTKISNGTTTSTVLWGSSNSGYGVAGSSSSSIGVSGSSSSSTGVYGSSTTGIGVYGFSSTQDQPALRGHSSLGNSTGVQGTSGSPPPTRAKTGVHGYAVQDSAARGVVGETTSGHGVHGIATTGYGGYFAGKVYTTKWYEAAETSTPAAPLANRARIFLRDNGSGLTQLCVRFHTGSVKVLATQT
jgi:hypothetical protein